MASSDCKNVLNLIPLYIDNLLSEEETDIVSRHLATCKSCKAEFEFMKSVMKTAKDLPKIDVPADFHNKLMSKVRTQKLKRNVTLKHINAFVAAAAVVVLSVLAVSDFHIYKNSENPDQYIKSGVSDSPVSFTSPKATDNKDRSLKQSEEISSEPAEKKTNEATDKTVGPVTEQQNPIPATVSLDEEDFMVATIILNDENRSDALEILSAFEKDETGYIVEHIDFITQKLSEAGIEVTITTNTESAKNYIIVK